MYVATSLSLDSTVFNKPQIMINFDGWEKRPYFKSVKKYHDEDHMIKLIDTKGVRMVDSEDELIDAINAYLENPNLDNEGRARILDEQLHKIDGQSGQRVAKNVLDFVDSI